MPSRAPMPALDRVIGRLPYLLAPRRPVGSERPPTQGTPTSLPRPAAGASSCFTAYHLADHGHSDHRGHREATGFDLGSDRVGREEGEAKAGGHGLLDGLV